MARIHLPKELTMRKVGDRTMPGVTQLGITPYMTKEEISEYIQYLDTILLRRALGLSDDGRGVGGTKKIASDPGSLVVRDLLPYYEFNIHTNVNDWQIDLTADTAGTATAGLTEMPDDEYWGIYGFTEITSSPSIYEVKFTSGAVTKEIWQVEQLRLLAETKIGIGISPVIYHPSQPIAITVTGKSTATVEPVFLGRVCEMRGVIVNG